MRLLLFLLLVPSICFASIIPGVPSYLTNGGLGAGSHEVLGYWNGNGYPGLTQDLSTDIALLNSLVRRDHLGNPDAYYLPETVEDFTAARGYSFEAERTTFFFFSFADFMAEIDAGRPVAIISDSSPDYFAPYEVAGVGYDIVDGVGHFGFIDRLTKALTWKPWVEADITHAWGVASVVTIKPVDAVPTPEPSTILLLATGLLGIIGMSRYRRN